MKDKLYTLVIFLFFIIGITVSIFMIGEAWDREAEHQEKKEKAYFEYIEKESAK